MVRVHNAGARTYDTVAVGVGVRPAYKVILVPGPCIKAVYKAFHSVRGAWVHAYLAVMVNRHEGPLGVNFGVDYANIKPVFFVDKVPVIDRCSAERVNAQAYPGIFNKLEINNILQIVNIVFTVIETLNKV